ncbi:MAG: hypothetical protein Q7S50_01950 [bacterium]|nr:hypothetical protein [bacterium]
MSALDNRLSPDQLKAPAGKFRVVKVQTPKDGLADSAAFFLVEDFPDRYDALVRWRDLAQAGWRSDEEGISYRFYDDQGRINDAIGAHVTEGDRKAPPGKFRIICVDFAGHPPAIKLVTDLDDRDAAIEYAKTAYEGPYTGFQVHDDTGAALIPV